MTWATDPGYPELKRFILEATGLDYYRPKDEDLYLRLQRRFEGARVQDSAAYLTLLKPGGPELDALVNELTIGETYFFRHREQYDAIALKVIPELLRQKAEEKRLAIWSAGCSIGPEPFSLAMLFEERFPELAAGWAVDIVGTDINREALRRAAAGIFEEWSLRSLEDYRRARFFEARGRQHILAERIRSRVVFEHHNLVTLPFAPPSALPGRIDLILCRNVTIYFEAATCARLVQQFEAALAPGGWLVVGHSEPNLEYFRNFEVVEYPGAILYRKPPAGALRPAAKFGALDSNAGAWMPRATTPARRNPMLASAPPPPATARGPSPLEALLAATGRGDFAEALRLSDQQIRKDGLRPAWHFLRAKSLVATGQTAEAEASFKRCLYLDRDHVLAHLQLGLLLRGSGRGSAARRHFATALRLLEAWAPGQRAPEAAELSAEELRSLLRIQLEAA